MLGAARHGGRRPPRSRLRLSGPEYCVNETEAVVHGVLHLCGFDHETDDGEMLDRQDRIVTSLGIEPRMTVEAEVD